jgi:hypothetical protein
MSTSMGITLIIHIAAGTLGLIAGYIALYSTKGAPLHRRAGLVFSCAMLTMGLLGALIAAVMGVWRPVNIPAGVLTSYLVITGLLTVRPITAGKRSVDSALMLVALAVGLMCLTFGFQAVANGGSRNGIPAFPFFLFGVIGTLAGVLDLRMIWVGGLHGASRLARHLWRMSFALFIAAMSFFFGQAEVIPKPIRIMPLLAIPVFAVLVTMFYWLWRIRVRRSSRGIVGVSAPEAVR